MMLNRNPIVIASKFGRYVDFETGKRPPGLISQPAHIKQEIEGLLKRLLTTGWTATSVIAADLIPGRSRSRSAMNALAKGAKHTSLQPAVSPSNA